MTITDQPLENFEVDDLVRCRLTGAVIKHGLAYRHGIVRAVHEHEDGTPRYDVEFPWYHESATDQRPRLYRMIHPIHLMKDPIAPAGGD